LMSFAIEIRLTSATTFEIRKNLGRIYATNSSGAQIIQGSGNEGGASNRESRILDMEFALSKHGQFRVCVGCRVAVDGLRFPSVGGRSPLRQIPAPTDAPINNRLSSAQHRHEFTPVYGCSRIAQKYPFRPTHLNAAVALRAGCVAPYVQRAELVWNRSSESPALENTRGTGRKKSHPKFPLCSLSLFSIAA
jgi:hypothetical protein